MGLFTKLFGTRSEREVKKLEPQVEAVMALEEPYKKLTDQELRAKTQEFKDRYASGETLDALLPEAFAVCREAADRVLGMRPYRVQVVGGIVLHQGRIAEMKTGEGKTLVAILPAYLNALAGRGVHIVTVNDYLAKRDSEWMGKVYRFLGLSVGLIVHDLTAEQRRAAYAADITYGTNNELGFDYLRDNMAIYKQEMVQRGHAFAIVDEVDSILIDEARTPLIISGKGEESSKLYEMADYFVSRLKKQVFSTTDNKELQDQYDCDYIVDEKDRSVSLTQKGIEKAEQFFNVENLADPENATLSHHINQAMKARGLMKRDIDYVVKDGEVRGRPSIGITVGAIPDNASSHYDIPSGLYISDVTKGSDAEAKGIKVGDILLECNGVEVKTTDDVAEIKSGLSVGDSIHFKIWRDGETFEVDVVLMDTNDIYN